MISSQVLLFSLISVAVEVTAVMRAVCSGVTLALSQA